MKNHHSNEHQGEKRKPDFSGGDRKGAAKNPQRRKDSAVNDGPGRQSNHRHGKYETERRPGNGNKYPEKAARRNGPQGRDEDRKERKPVSGPGSRSYAHGRSTDDRRNMARNRPKRPRIKIRKDDQQGSQLQSSDGTVRLNKYIAHAGICSRREADELIKAGLVTVNDEVITEMGVKVKPGDVVKYNGERLRAEKKVYLLLNKPKDIVTTSDDPEGRKTVMDLVRNACDQRLYPVGRLDRNTTGVLLMTNDGSLATRLMHPKYNVRKIYHVILQSTLKPEDMNRLAEGITLEDGFIQPDAVSFISEEARNEVGIEIHSGRNRIVRRMFEHLGYKVTRLDRVVFAGLTKKNLPRGKYRFLTEREINRLKMNAFE